MNEMFEPARRAYRNASVKLIEADRLLPIDAAIGAIAVAHDFATMAGMDPHAAIEWMRSATDTMERQLLSDAASCQ